MAFSLTLPSSNLKLPIRGVKSAAGIQKLRRGRQLEIVVVQKSPRTLLWHLNLFLERFQINAKKPKPKYSDQSQCEQTAIRLVFFPLAEKLAQDFKPITKSSNRNHVITFDRHLKTALLLSTLI